MREGGVEVVLVSSRPPRAMRPFHQQLGLMTPMIACDGALLWNVQAGAGLVARLAVGRRWRPRSWPRAATWAPWPTWRATTSGSPTGWATSCATASSTTRCPSRTRWAASTRCIRAGEPIDKVFLDLRDLDDDDGGRGRGSRSSGRSPDRANIYENVPGILDFTSIDASKAAMAQQLARQMQIPAEQMMAIGDHDSDAALLQWAGVGRGHGQRHARPPRRRPT